MDICLLDPLSDDFFWVLSEKVKIVFSICRFQELRLEQEEMEESTNFQERPLDYYNSGGRSNCEYFYNSCKFNRKGTFK